MGELIVQYPRKVQGTFCWAYQTKHAVDRTTVRRSLLTSPNDISLELEWDGGVYRLTLRSRDGLTFEGSFEGQYPEELITGTATASFYSNKEQHALIGKWVEDETTCLWWAELSEVPHFADEA